MLAIILAILCLFMLGTIIFLVLRQSNQKTDTTLHEWLRSSQTQMQELQRTLLENSRQSNHHLSESMREQTREIHDRLSRAAEVIGELKREAGQFTEISKSMRDLDALLKSPKLRGNMGERVLADLIGQVFPKQHFFLQHRFRSGVIVDAAIQTDAGILPIDSKFPMEHFQAMHKGETQAERDQAKKEFVRDVKKHIDAIGTKYILPEEGTMDFALMYVPSEAVYYEIAGDDSLLDYARRQRVYPVSPNTLYAHLQTILLSFEGKKIESTAKEAFALLRAVEKDYKQFDAQYQTLGKHLTNAQNMFVTSSQSLATLGRGLSNMRQLTSSEEKSASFKSTEEI